MAKSVVAIVKGAEPEEMVAATLNHLGGAGTFVKPGATVVLKPNAGHVGPAESSVNTNPAVVAAVIKLLRTVHPKEIIVAESSAQGCDTLECLEASGIRAAAEAAGADRIIDIKREQDLVEVPIPDARSAINQVMLPRFLVEADCVVNLPIFKSHVSMVFTCALKNIKGVVQDKVHVRMHHTDLAGAMMDLWSVIKVDLTIADLIRPMEGFGPHSGTPTDFGCVAAGTDPVALDATICRMVGLDVDKVDYFRAARERGLGTFDEGEIEIRGNTVQEVYKKLWLPYIEGFSAWPEYHIDAEGACSSCQALAAYTMVKLKGLGVYDKNAGIHLLLGTKKRLPSGAEPGDDLILMGDCTSGLKSKIEQGGSKCIFVKGCPPLEALPFLAITDRESQPKRVDPIAARERFETENKVFEAWVKEQRAAKDREESVSEETAKEES